MIDELILKTRTYRSFYQEINISSEVLRELINLARMGGSAANKQPLKYIIANKPELNARIFPHLKWANYLPDWPGPVEGERPSAYIICLLDTLISKEAGFDLGIATQNILLGATSKGLGGCRIGSFSPEVSNIFGLPQHLKVELILVLGKPKETVIIEDISYPGSDIKYWRDESNAHHVPKRSLNEIIIDIKKVRPL